MRIVEIVPVTKTKYRVVTDEQLAFMLYKGELSRYRLKENGELSAEIFQEIFREILVKRAKLRAMHLLTRMDYTEAELIKEISGVNPLKCMKCGKCSASCPSFNEMDIKPHQFVSYVANENIEELVNSKSLWKCLSCFACVERCPRDVKPGKLIDAARQLVVRQKGQNYLTPDEIPELLDPELPQQLLVSAFRRYRR